VRGKESRSPAREYSALVVLKNLSNIYKTFPPHIFVLLPLTPTLSPLRGAREKANGWALAMYSSISFDALGLGME
jgi:hypothetical protein